MLTSLLTLTKHPGGLQGCTTGVGPVVLERALIGWYDGCLKLIHVLLFAGISAHVVKGAGAFCTPFCT